MQAAGIGVSGIASLVARGDFPRGPWAQGGHKDPAHTMTATVWFAYLCANVTAAR